jgi:hypothetical protein
MLQLLLLLLHWVRVSSLPPSGAQVLLTNADRYSKGILSEILDFVMGTVSPGPACTPQPPACVLEGCDAIPGTGLGAGMRAARVGAWGGVRGGGRAPPAWRS